MSQFEGRVVLVTGAASGIGLATAERLARADAQVVATDTDRDGLKDALAELIGDVEVGHPPGRGIADQLSQLRLADPLGQQV